MQPVNDYPFLKREMDGKFRKGVITNFTADQGELERETARGGVSLDSAGSNLFVLRKREGRYYLNIYINSFEEDVPELPERTVTELVFRDDDLDRQRAISYLRKQGFSLKFFRKYLSREQDVPFGRSKKQYVLPEDTALRRACPADADAVTEALYANFDPLTACLPGKDEVAEALSENDGRERYFLLKTGGKTAGVLHTEHRKNSFEIRHLAVCGEFRGEGLSSFILRKIIEENPQKSNVWVNYSNIPAKSLYSNHGYSDTGRKSAVLVWERR